MYSSEDKAFVTISDRIYPVDNTRPVKSYAFVNKGADFSGWYHYRVRQVDFDGSQTYSDKVSVLNESETRLSVYPNPTVSTVQVGIDIEEESDVKILVYNIKGDRVAGLSYNGQFDKGSHILPFDLSQLPAGAYTFNVVINGSVKNSIVVKE